LNDFLTKQLWGSIDFHSMCFLHTIEVNGDQQLFGDRVYFVFGEI